MDRERSRRDRHRAKLALPETGGTEGVKCMMGVNERASGSQNNWTKTFGLALVPNANGPLVLPLG